MKIQQKLKFEWKFNKDSILNKNSTKTRVEFDRNLNLRVNSITIRFEWTFDKNLSLSENWTNTWFWVKIWKKLEFSENSANENSTEIRVWVKIQQNIGF